MSGKLRRAALCATLAAAGLATAFATPAARAATSSTTPPTMASTTAGQPGSGLQRELESLVRTPGGPPGVIVTFDVAGRRSVFRAGAADVATGREPDPGDAMRIASVAKAYSGAVALQLVQRHVLGLDDTVARRLPQLPRAWGRVTLRELLQHTSGLPDYSQAPAFQAVVRADPRHVFDPHHLLDYVAGQPLGFTPGSRYKYSNSDNIAIALMAEAATGQSYDALLRRLVERPLGLRHTSLPLGYELPEPYLHGYDVPLSGPPEDVSTVISASGAWASGGIVATPSDLNVFMRAYGGPQLLAPWVRHAQFAFIPGIPSPPVPARTRSGWASSATGPAAAPWSGTPATRWGTRSSRRPRRMARGRSHSRSTGRSRRRRTLRSWPACGRCRRTSCAHC